jgi:hypothetical protein
LATFLSAAQQSKSDKNGLYGVGKTEIQKFGERTEFIRARNGGDRPNRFHRAGH